MLKVLFIALYTVALIIPGYTFAVANYNSSIAILKDSPNLQTSLYVAFRLFGLYALTLVWLQMMVGPLMLRLGKVFGAGIVKFHRTQGTFALLFALIHPLLFYAGFLAGKTNGSILTAVADYLGPDYAIYGLFGQITLLLLITTVSTALLMRKKWMRNRWKAIHYLNYLVFYLACAHSWFIGTDVQTEPMLSLFRFFGLSTLLVILYRFIFQPIIKRIGPSNKPDAPIPGNVQ